MLKGIGILLPSLVFSWSNNDVGEEHAHLARVDFVDERVIGEVHALNRIDGISENALPIGREVHTGVRHCRSHGAERGRRAARGDLIGGIWNRDDSPVPVEADGANSISAVVANDVHLQPVDALAVEKHPHDERAFPHALRIPAERYDHVRIVAPNLDNLPAHVHPRDERPSPQPESPRHGLLRSSPEVRGGEK